MSRAFVWMGGGVAALLLGCATTPKGQPSLCPLQPAPSNEVLAREPDVWFSLLLHGYSAASDSGSRPVLDCSGNSIAQRVEPQDCSEKAEDASLLPTNALTRQDLVLEQLDPNTWLAWVMVRRLSNGEAQGPVAVVDVQEGQLHVRAMGLLRSYAHRPKLRLERVADTRILAAEGELCPEGAQVECQRSVQLLPARGRRFFAEPLMDAQGKCVSPGRLHMTRTESATLPNGWVRQSALHTQLVFEAQRILAQE